MEQPIRAPRTSMCVCAASDCPLFPRAAEGSMATAPCLILPLLVERNRTLFLARRLPRILCRYSLYRYLEQLGARRASKMPAEATSLGTASKAMLRIRCLCRPWLWMLLLGASAHAQTCQSAADMEASVRTAIEA